jgi:Transmembrane secretion effector
MVSAEELGSAYTLARLQMDVSGIIGPLLAGLLIPLAGVSFIFGANALGFLLIFLAILQWKRVAAGFAFVIMIIVRVGPGFRLSIDFTKNLTFESAPVTIFSQDLDPTRPPAPQDGPVSITAQFQIDPTRRSECVELMREARLIFLRNGAYRWHLYEDLNQPNKFRMEVVEPSWKEHVLQRERLTKNEKEVID